MVNIKNGVRFNGKHSYFYYGLYLARRPKKDVPEIKSNFIEIPGMDGGIDATENIAGDVKYKNRPLQLYFTAFAEIDEQATVQDLIVNDLHGKTVEVILDEDSNWYYKGRASVEFQDITPHKIGVKISVDAEPYKRFIRETHIHFPIDSTSSAYRFEFGRDSSKQDWNTQFLFGTPDNPTGDWSGFSQVNIVWDNQLAPHTNNPFVQFVDSSGHVKNYNLSYSLGFYDVTMATLTSDNIDISNVYRVLISGIGGCYLQGIAEGALLTVENDRLRVCPRINTVSTNGMKVVLNGRTITLSNNTERQYADIMLESGENTLVFVPTTEGSGQYIDLYFRRGRL